MNTRTYVLTLALVLAAFGLSACSPEAIPIGPSSTDPANSSVIIINIGGDTTGGGGDDKNDGGGGNPGEPNTGPSIIHPGNMACGVGQNFSRQVVASDPDSDQRLTWTAFNLPRNLTIGSSTGIISGSCTSSAAAESPWTTTVTVSDGQANDSVTFEFEVV